MKKTLFFVAAVVAALFIPRNSSAQTNLQVFYDFGKDRKMITTTLEGFHMDNWGNTFFFIDYDYRLKADQGYTVDSPSSTYFEIARCLNFWQDTKMGAFSLQVEYNGGFGTFGTPTAGGFYSVNHAMLLGVDYFLHSKDFKNTLNLKVLYKKFKNLASDLPMQFTAVWGCQDLFGLNGLRFSGFADVWWEGSTAVFISEPQLWYGIGSHFNLGGEIELSSNFAGHQGFMCNPCLGVKWVF